ncbi:MAG: flagellar type III secretion system pore protein FliP [Firmicutes bacterium]|nr:flagellar type III secretion system pore protein FliP [Bacillota bacterium]
MTKKLFFLILFITILLVAITGSVAAQPEIPVPSIDLNIKPAESPGEIALSLQILFLLTILSLAPALLIMVTSFTRIIIVLSFTRSAVGVQQMPPNQALIGLALFLTFFIMSPVIAEVNETALQPYMNQEIEQETAIKRVLEPVRRFMFKYTREKDLALFLKLSDIESALEFDDIPTTALIPAFIISEMKTAFEMGFFLYVPFLIIDMVVASTLMSMGMMMLPPVMISLPFKILLFVMVDGWNLIIKSLLLGFS